MLWNDGSFFSVLRCVAECCSVMQCDAVCCSVCYSMLLCVAVCCSTMWGVGVLLLPAASPAIRRCCGIYVQWGFHTRDVFTGFFCRHLWICIHFFSPSIRMLWHSCSKYHSARCYPFLVSCVGLFFIHLHRRSPFISIRLCQHICRSLFHTCTFL